MFGKHPHPDDEEPSPAKRHKADESSIPAESSSPRPSQREQERSSDESRMSERSHTAAVSASDSQTEITVPSQVSPDRFSLLRVLEGRRTQCTQAYSALGTAYVFDGLVPL